MKILFVFVHMVMKVGSGLDMACMWIIVLPLVHPESLNKLFNLMQTMFNQEKKDIKTPASYGQGDYE